MSVQLPPGFRPGSLGEKIERLVQRGFALLYERIIGPVSDAVRSGVDNYLERIETAMLPFARPILDRMLESDVLPADYRNAIERTRNPQGQVEIGAVVSAAVGIVVGLIAGAMRPAARAMEYMVERVFHTGRPDPAMLVRMFWLRQIGPQQLENYLADLGFTAEMRAAITEATRPRLAPRDVFDYGRRFGLMPGEVEQYLASLGFDDHEIHYMTKLTQFMPGPSDLIRFGVREAWRDDVAAKWGYDADFPAQFREEMERLGDAENWARLYWRAHWDLPGELRVRQMLHRGFITEEEYGDYLRIADIPQRWRELLTRTAYNPYTRVDIRRMHQLGVIGDGGLVDAYKAGGYDQEKAENMAEFTIKYNQSADREATKADILGGYRDGLLSESEAIEWLQAIDFPEYVAAFLIAREKVKKEKTLVDAQCKVVRELYIHREITRTDAANRLAAIGLTSGEITTKLELWDIERAETTARPSRGTLDKFFKDDTITERQYLDGLATLGYVEQYRQMYLSSILKDKAEAARKEEERARSEEETIRTRRAKTTYQAAKAALDVDIAELQTAIAETQLALDERAARYRLEKQAIEDAVSIAQLQEDLRTALRPLEMDQVETRLEQEQTGAEIARIEAEIAAIRLEALPAEIELSAAEVASIVADRREQIQGLKLQQEAVETAQAELKTYVTDNVLTLPSPDRSIIDGIMGPVQTWAADVWARIQSAIDLAITEAAGGPLVFSPEATELMLASFRVAIERVQDESQAIQESIYALQARVATPIEGLTAEERERLIAERRVQIAELRRELAVLDAAIEAIRQERLQVEWDFEQRRDVVERVRSLAEVERSYLLDRREMEARLENLRVNLAQLREQKARLAFSYRQGLAA